jgi:hypothetical protein
LGRWGLQHRSQRRCSALSRKGRGPDSLLSSTFKPISREVSRQLFPDYFRQPDSKT